MRLPFLVLLTVLCLRAEWRFGQGQVDITPPRQMPMAGYYHVRLNEETHDPLYAKAIVIESDGAKAALVALDLIQAPKQFVDKARNVIEQQTGIRTVMISATHSHTGPELGGRLRGVTPETEKLAQSYYSLLPGKIAEAVRMANSRLQTGRIRAGIGHEDSISFIRRFRMIDGTTGWNPGKRNPKIGAPLGTIDPAVPVVVFESPQGQTEALYVNFANHLDTVGGAAFSADYAFPLAQTLGRVKGAQQLTLFTLGCAGNINHIDVSHNRPQKGPAEAARIGTVLAAAALKAMEKAADVEPGGVQASNETVQLPLAKFSPDEVEKARAIVGNYGKPNADPFLEQVNAFKVLDLVAREGRPHDAEVQVVALGKQVAFVGLPGEIFVEHGKAIKLASPFPVTIAVSLANGHLGYVPDRRAYAEGAYEVISTRVGEGGGERLVESAVRQLAELFRASSSPAASR